MGVNERTGASKLLGLELIRFASSFAVLLWHYRHFYRLEGAPPAVVANFPLYGFLAPFYDYGIYGVQLFWGISGFIFFWKYGAAIADREISAGRFAWLRFTRLYPLHFVTLLTVALLQPVHAALTGAPFIYHDDDALQFVLQLGMATQWGLAMPYSFNGPIWSVSAEILVYAIFFGLALLARNRVQLCLIMIIGTVVLMMIGIDSFPALFCSAYFFAGGLAAELHLRSKRAVRDCVFAILFLAGIVIAAAFVERLGRDGIRPLILLIALMPLLFVAAARWSFLDRWARPIRAAGNLTHSTYLCHFPLQLVLAITLATTGLVAPVASPWFLTAYLAATLVVGHLVFTRFEKPVQDWLRNWASPRATAAA